MSKGKQVKVKLLTDGCYSGLSSIVFPLELKATVGINKWGNKSVEMTGQELIALGASASAFVVEQHYSWLFKDNEVEVVE